MPPPSALRSSARPQGQWALSHTVPGMWAQACARTGLGLPAIPQGMAGRVRETPGAGRVGKEEWGWRGQWLFREGPRGHQVSQRLPCSLWAQPRTQCRPHNHGRTMGAPRLGEGHLQLMAEPREVTAGGMFWKALLNQDRRSCEKHSGERRKAPSELPGGRSRPMQPGLRESLGFSLWATCMWGCRAHRGTGGGGAELGLDCQCSDER